MEAELFPRRLTREGNSDLRWECKSVSTFFPVFLGGIFGGIGDRGVFRTIRLINDGDVANALRTKRSEIKSGDSRVIASPRRNDR